MRTTRRAFLGGAVGTTAATLGLGTFPAARAQGTDLSAWFSDTGNADEVVDRTEKSEVTITVGAGGNSGNLAFGPAAVRIDPGTTVVWEWTGKGGAHNVVASDGSFESDYYTAAGKTFEYTPSSEGVVRYFCAPHKAAGMKGALVVGDTEVTLGGGSGDGASTTTTTEGGGSTGESTAAAPQEETATPAPEHPTFDGWLANTDNYDGVVQRLDEDVVRVAVGAEGNGGRLAFDPPAIQVDPGTTVVWEWMTSGVEHDVVAADGRFASGTSTRVGHRYGVTFEGSGVAKYECRSHSDAGMRGVVVVGDGEEEGLDATGLAMLGGGLAVLGATGLSGVSLHRDTASGPDDGM